MRDFVASVDPGLVGTGVALWKTTAREGKPAAVKVFTPYRRADWTDRARMLRVSLAAYFRDNGVHTVFIELPEYFGGSAVGNAAARKGDVVKLCFAAAAAGFAAWDAGADVVQYVDVTQWKGQLPKAVVERRVRRIVGDEADDGSRIESHSWDAVGIGLWAGGRFK